MVTFFNVFGLLFWMSGIGVCAASKGALQEAEGLVAFLTGTVFIVGAALLDGLNRFNKRMEGIPNAPEKLRKICPQCRNFVHGEAKVCCHCGHREQ